MRSSTISLSGVLQCADEIDRLIARGGDPGPLAGVPVTVKTNIDQAGFATSNGTRLQRNQIAQTNSPAVDNFERAGAMLVGRTNAPAFALRWFTSNLLYGATVNPRNRDRSLLEARAGVPRQELRAGSDTWHSARTSAARCVIRSMPAEYMGYSRCISFGVGWDSSHSPPYARVRARPVFEATPSNSEHGW
jgi:hypothetical protein